MKKIFLFIIVICVFMTGCGRYSERDVTKNILKKYNKGSGYKLKGELEINNNDDVYNYYVNSFFNKKKGFYKVVLTNKSNDFKQIIIKNDEGVFLLTPSMNKSFKFSSDWPYNNSQIYLYDTIINDIKNDKNRKFEKKNNKFIFNTKVNYSNNTKLSSQKIIYDKNYMLKQVDIYDRDNNVCMKLTIDKISFSPKFDIIFNIILSSCNSML